MVSVTFFGNREDFFTGFSVVGHAGMAKYGKDIVCAAISSATYMVVNTLTDVVGVVPEKMEISSGRVCVTIGGRDFFRCKDLLLGFRLHILELSKQYPDYVCVDFK